MSVIWLVLAFGLGLIAKQLKLPPLVGYLAAGFILHAQGYQSDAQLGLISDLGITLMLFTIGLKVNFKQLMSPSIWGTTVVSMSSWLILCMPAITFGAVALSSTIFDMTIESSALVAFALSFSSTVCVIKILEDNSELKTRHSDLAISVLIIQDLIAVLFLFSATGKVPSVWSGLLLLLIFCRPVIDAIYKRVGHGELVPLSGIVLAFGGAALFEALDLKGDLGALAAGMLLAGLPNTSELYKSLISFKDIFLIGFFLSIGFSAVPTWDMWASALLICALLPIKFLLFFGVIALFGFRARTSFLSAILLANFSEFGLIVASLGQEYGWLSKEWLVIIALATAISFVISSLIYQFSHRIFTSNKAFLTRLQRKSADKEMTQCPVDLEILVVGMGRVGLGAYKELNQRFEGKIWGVEVEAERAQRLQAEGFNILTSDADDIEFWEALKLDNLSLVMLALPSTTEMKNILRQIRTTPYTGKISAVAHYPDEQKELIDLGADVAFNYYSEVGTGFADESMRLLKSGRD